MFWLEVVLMVFPLVVLRVTKLRNDSRMLYLSALSALLGYCNMASVLFAGGVQSSVVATTTSRPGKSC